VERSDTHLVDSYGIALDAAKRGNCDTRLARFEI
jgi:hypothetical protein